MVGRGVVLLLALSGADSASAVSNLSEADYLAELPTVLTSSRLAQPLMDAPNAITVIDRKQIELSGYRKLADLFRLAPGLFVGQSTGWSYNVTHTFADEYARRMQVMVDGRSVYLPSTGGVRWDTLPLAIQDIERIEVVRGPNAASFGANAFTGIINIITRHPDDVAGRVVQLSAGDHAYREGVFRWAGRAENSSHRVTLGKRLDGGMTYQRDDESSRSLSYRGEYALGEQENLSLQFGTLTGDRGVGDFNDSADSLYQQDVTSRFFQADYRLELSPGRSLQTKLFFNSLRTLEDVPIAPVQNLIPSGAYYESDLLSQRWHLEAQLDNIFSPTLRSVLGAYLRRDSVQSMHFWSRSDKLNVDSHGLFGHLEWRLADAWLMNAGAFWEDYDLVGGRFSPRATLHWQPSAQHALRFGLSKAYRNPVLFEARADRRIRVLSQDGSLLATLPPLILSTGNVVPESILSREIGYFGRWPEKDVTLDIRLFRERVSNYIDLTCPAVNANDCRAANLLNPSYQPRDWTNTGAAIQQGYEIQAKWNPAPENMVMLNHAHLRIDADIKDKAYSPPHITGLHVMHRFPGRVDMSLAQYWISGFQAIGQGAIPAHRRLDARIAKSFRVDGMNGIIALTWHNLTDPYYAFDNEAQVDLFDRRVGIDFQLDF